MTLRFSHSEHTPVYSKASADEIGRVTRYVVDAAHQRVAAVHVAGRKQRALFADWANVVGFGPDAVVVDDEDHLRSPRGDYENKIAAGHLDLQGRRVLTDAGFDVGVLVDVEFDEHTGTLTLLETDRARVAGDGLIAIGRYAVIVQQSAVNVPEAVTPPEAPPPV